MSGMLHAETKELNQVVQEAWNNLPATFLRKLHYSVSKSLKCINTVLNVNDNFNLHWLIYC